MFTKRKVILKIEGIVCGILLLAAMAGPFTPESLARPVSGTIYTNKTTYDQFHEIIFINGYNMSRRQYKIDFYDAKNHKVGTFVVHVDSQGNFKKPAVYKINGTEVQGLWRADAIHGNEIEASCTFTVLQSAIPEFPAVFAGIVVSGMCAFIYHTIKKRKGAVAA